MAKRYPGTACLVALAISVGASTASAQASRLAADDPGATGALVVLSGSGAEALLVDPRDNRVVARFQTGPDPREVALSPDGRFAYVTSYGWDPGSGPAVLPASAEGAAPAAPAPAAGAGALPRARGVTVLDLAQRRIHAVFQPADYRHLGSITVGSDGRRLWMTSEAEGGIVELDALSGQVKMLWKTEAGPAGAIAVSRDGRRVYVAQPASDAIVAVDRLTVVPARVPTGRRPTGLALAPGGSELWVTNSGEGTISIVRTRRLREVERIPSGGREPVRIAFHPGRNEAWISHRGSRTVTVLDVASGAVVADVALPAEPRTITFSDDGRRAYVSSPASHRVFAIDVGSRALLEALDAGARPGGMVWTRHGGP